MSELGLAQCEDSFPTTKPKKDRDSRVDCLLETGVSISRQDERSGRREKTLTSVVRNKGLRDALLRGPKTFVLCNRKPSYSVLWSVLGVARSEVSMEHASGGSYVREGTAAQALFSLIVVLNRNTLALSTIWSTERGR